MSLGTLHLIQLMSVLLAIFYVVFEEERKADDVFLWMVELSNHYVLMPIFFYLLFRMKNVQIYYEAIELVENVSKTEQRMLSYRRTAYLYVMSIICIVVIKEVLLNPWTYFGQIKWDYDQEA